MEYSAKVDQTSPIVRKLTIKVPAKEVTRHFERGLAEVQRTAKIKGFRPGNVPISIVKQYYGEDVRHQVFHNVIDESFRLALKEHQLKAVGRPQIETPDHKTGAGDHDHGIKENQDLTFIATVEVLPEIEVKNYKGLSVSQESASVTDKDVDVVIKGLMDNHAELVPAEESAKVNKSDFVDMTFSGGVVTETGIDEKPGMKGTRLVEVGTGSLIPGFEEELIGMKKAETKTFKIDFPKEYAEAEIAGKAAQFTVTINEIKNKKLPDLDDEFAKDLGYDTVAEMKAKAEEHLTRERQTEVERKLKSDILQALIDKNGFDVPQALVQAQTRALAQEVGGNLKNQGYSEQMIQEAMTGELENLKKRAENQVRASLLLEAISKKEGLKLGENDIEDEIKKMAVSMKVEEEQIREFYLKNDGRKDDLEFRLREEKALQFLIQNAKIKKA